MYFFALFPTRTSRGRQNKNKKNTNFSSFHLPDFCLPVFPAWVRPFYASANLLSFCFPCLELPALGPRLYALYIDQNSICDAFLPAFKAQLEKVAAKDELRQPHQGKMRIKFNWKSLSHLFSVFSTLRYLAHSCLVFWFLNFFIFSSLLAWLTYDLEQFLINPICSVRWGETFLSRLLRFSACLILPFLFFISVSPLFSSLSLQIQNACSKTHWLVENWSWSTQDFKFRVRDIKVRKCREYVPSKVLFVLTIHCCSRIN